MNRLILILLSAALIASVQAFAQEGDSTTQIDFETADDQAISVELTTQIDFEAADDKVISLFEATKYPADGRRDAYLQWTLVCFAPITVWVPNGLHWYKFEESGSLDVDAQGNPQRWRLIGENKSLRDIGTIVEAVGLAVVVVGGLAGLAMQDSGTLQLSVLGGLAVRASGIFMVVLALPRATRIQ
jgi:hypothetical protein